MGNGKARARGRVVEQDRNGGDEIDGYERARAGV